MARARIPDTDGDAAVEAALAGATGRDVTATAVRYLLQRLADFSPGTSVEVRVPPFGAVQVIQGPRHTRGTPPNVVELPAPLWIAVATGGTPWAEAVGGGSVAASGTRADLGGHVPVWWPAGAGRR